MKKTSMMVLMAVVFSAGLVWAQSPQQPDPGTQINLEMRRMELRHKQLDIQQRELEMAIRIAQVMDFQTFEVFLQGRRRR